MNRTYRPAPNLGQALKDVIAAGADWIHFDVMDNHYVPNLSFELLAYLKAQGDKVNLAHAGLGARPAADAAGWATS